MNHIDETPTYASGQHPKAGDLIEFGTRHERMLVTSTDYQGPEFLIYSGCQKYGEQYLSMMVLIARHGAPEPETNSKG
jgi:hypothetical protein